MENSNLTKEEINDLVTNHKDEIEKIIQEFYFDLKKDLADGDEQNERGR